MCRRQLVAESATHAPAPRRVRQYVDRGLCGRERGRNLAGAIQVIGARSAQDFVNRLAGDELERIRIPRQRLIQLGGVVMQIVDAVPVRVVIEAFPQRLQLRELEFIELEPNRCAARGTCEIVAKRPRDRPDALASIQVAVDEKARAHRRRRVDKGCELGMYGISPGT
jgi:hypothetical protein